MRFGIGQLIEKLERGDGNVDTACEQYEPNLIVTITTPQYALPISKGNRWCHRNNYAEIKPSFMGVKHERLPHYRH